MGWSDEFGALGEAELWGLNRGDTTASISRDNVVLHGSDSPNKKQERQDKKLLGEARKG